MVGKIKAILSNRRIVLLERIMHNFKQVARVEVLGGYMCEVTSERITNMLQQIGSLEQKLLEMSQGADLMRDALFRIVESTDGHARDTIQGVIGMLVAMSGSLKYLAQDVEFVAGI